MISRKEGGGWLADLQPAGRGGKRFRKSFATQAEAKAWEAWITAESNKDAQWSPEKRDLRRVSELVKLWYSTHGQGLRAGLNTKTRLLQAAEAMGDPHADRFDAEMFANYRSKRLAAGISANNMNRELAYFRAMFNELHRLGTWARVNPLAKLRQFKIAERELSYLTLDQIGSLLSALSQARNKHVHLATRLALETGARWSEAEQLAISQVHRGAVQFSKTKSGKVRTVPISAELVAELRSHHAKHGVMARIFGPCWAAFREGIERTDIELPKGQMTHALRHTFASHFMMEGGNILTLQRILGHQSLQMTMRYAHLAPEHLQEAKTLNPMSIIRSRAAEIKQASAPADVNHEDSPTALTKEGVEGSGGAVNGSPPTHSDALVLAAEVLQ